MKVRQSGFTQIEVLVIALVAALVVATVCHTLILRQRAARPEQAGLGQLAVRRGLDRLKADLRELSATDGDVLAADSVFISVRALRKAGLVCNVDVANENMDVAELGAAFETSDNLLIFRDGADARSAADDDWINATIARSTRSNACAQHPVSGTVRRLQVKAPLEGVRTGALVRSWVPVRYRLVDHGHKGILTRIERSDSLPLLRNLATQMNRGLRFRYWNTMNAALPAGTLGDQTGQIGRIEVKLTRGAPYTDTLVTTIELRGNRGSR